jgi:hypothetical protein
MRIALAALNLAALNLAALNLAALNLAALTLIAGPATADPVFTDPRDGAVYGWVRHGDINWMDRNLSWRGNGARCPGDTDRGCAASGALYSPAMAATACPPGSRLPTGADFAALAAALGGASASVGAAARAGQAVEAWGAPGSVIGGRHRAIPGHAIFLQQPQPTAEGRVVIGWHRYPVQGGVAFEPTQRPADALDDIAASVRCVRAV